MDFNQLIKNWHIKASNEDYFSGFVFEYLAFIAFLKKRKFTNEVNDRDAIQKLKQDNEIKEKYLQKVKNDRNIEIAWQHIKNELDKSSLGNVSHNNEEVAEIRWWNCSSDELSQHSNDEIKGIIRNFDDWENMVEFWYSIRNNFFHGGKNPQDKRDQLLIENGYKTLHPVVEIFLTDES